MAIYNPLTGPTANNVLNANPIGDFQRNISDAYTGSLNKILDEPLPHKINIDNRGMYYADEFTPEINTYKTDIGTIGNLRHATTTAQYKDKIAQGLVPEHMKNIGAKPGFVENLIGGVGANILGLGHEFEGLTKNWSQIKDPNWWRATGEDVLANLYGSIKGETGVSEQEIYDSMLGNFIYDEGIMRNVLDWGTMTEDTNTRGYNKDKKGMSLQRFKNLYQIKKNRQKQDMQQKIRQGEAAEAAKQKPTPAYTGPVTHSFDPKQDTGRRPDKPGGFTDPGKGSYGPHMAYGGRASYFDGGLLSLWPR